MEVDLRRFLSKHGIEWRDKGPNCSRNHVNVCCPWCGSADQGFHIGISETGEGYYCLRNPRHCGINLYNLFIALKIPKKALENLKFKPSKRTYEVEERDYSAFLYFSPAEEDQEILDYLRSRNFSDPIRTCQKFNLKFAEFGEWCGRLIIPMTKGWTGRSIRDHIQPRYKSETDESGYWSYGKGTSCIVIEGAVDGMRIASVTSEFAVSAMCGKRLAAALIISLRERNFSTIYYVPDNGVPCAEYVDATTLLRSYCTNSEVVTAHFPDYVKDAALMSEAETRQWLTTLRPQHQLRNQAVY